MSDNKKMILNLFGGMQDALFMGGGNFDGGEFVSFMQPGQFISQNLQETDGSDDMAIQAQIANVLVDSSYVNKYKETSYTKGTELLGSVDSVYYDIMEHTAVPQKVQTPDQLNEIKRLTDWLAANEANYNKFRDEYFDANDAFDFENHKQSPSASRLNRLHQAILDAYKNWESFGQRSTYDNNYGQLIYLTSENPVSFWGKLKTNMRTSIRQAPTKGSYYPTFLVPAVSSWASAGWATFERTINESDSYQYSKSTSWAGGISAGWGLWSFGASAGGSSTFQQQQSSASTVHLKFDYLRVRIMRPWLLSDVFGYNFWAWNKAFGGQTISDGGSIHNTPPTRPVGRMPVLPTYLIIVRNLELSATFTSEEKTFFAEQIRSNVSVGWGPFSLSGSYSESSSTQTAKASFDGATFKISQPQIIARTGIMLPKSPNPNINLNWGTDACLPGMLCNSNAQATIDEIRKQDFEIAKEDAAYKAAQLEAQDVADLYFAQRWQSRNVITNPVDSDKVTNSSKTKQK